MFSYCALGLLRADLPHSFAEISRKGGGAQLTLEIITMIGALIIYLGLSWQYFVCIYLPTFYVGWFLEHLENYYEHFGGSPDDRFANSTSYYGRLYNFLFCNEGYHQEHHIRPNVHWSMRPQTRMDYRDVLDRPHRVVLNFPPVLSWLEHDRIASYDQSNCSEKISTNLSANGTVVSG
jgi:fatty acid desaturase